MSLEQKTHREWGKIRERIDGKPRLPKKVVEYYDIASRMSTDLICLPYSIGKTLVKGTFLHTTALIHSPNTSREYIQYGSHYFSEIWQREWDEISQWQTENPIKLRLMGAVSIPLIFSLIALFPTGPVL